MMAAATMVIGGRTPEVSGQTFFFFAPLLIPVFILGVPIADAAFAFVRRTARGTGFHTPDKDHVHHRLLRLGHGPRRTVVILWAWTAVLSGIVLYPLFGSQANAFIPFGVIVLGLALYTLFRPGLGKEALELEDDEEDDQGDDEDERDSARRTVPGSSRIGHFSEAVVSGRDDEDGSVRPSRASDRRSYITGAGRRRGT
jgi:UDP-GlcNAc:undecaprenyl-phosphate GlcNAc-1-phosphate transferase